MSVVYVFTGEKMVKLLFSKIEIIAKNEIVISGMTPFKVIRLIAA